MKSTVEILNEAKQIVDALESVEGLDEDIFIAMLEQFEGELEEKLRRYRYVASLLTNEHTFLATEAARLRAKASVCAASIDKVNNRMRALLVAYREVTGESKVKAMDSTFWLQKPPLKLQAPDDPERWPEDVRVVSVSLNKVEARKRIEAGQDLPGFSLVEGEPVVRWK